MKSYPSYDALAIDLDLHFFDKISVLRNAGNRCDDGSWFAITDDGQCHLFNKYGNLDDINKLHVLKEKYIRKDITKIIIPNSVMSIRAWTFCNCSSLTYVTIPDSVTNIGDYAFGDCNSLASMILPKSIVYIAYDAFIRCKNLKNVFFKGKTLKQVKNMCDYPWGIKDKDVIKAEL